MIVGVMSHKCIDATTRAAYDLGLKVPADEVHASFRAALGWWYADLKTAADFVRQVQGMSPS